MMMISGNVRSRPPPELAVQLLLLGLPFIAIFVESFECPGVRGGDGVYYLSNVTVLDDDWQYDRYCRVSSKPLEDVGLEVDESVAVIGTLRCEPCWDDNCDVLLVNPEYVFWDDDAAAFLEAPACEGSGGAVATCSAADLDAVCLTAENATSTADDSRRHRSCSDGEFVCESKVTGSWCKGSVEDARSRQVACPPSDGSSSRWTDECNGAVSCPPRVVSSFEALGAYWYGSIGMSVDEYWTDTMWGATACRGKVDEEIKPPPCSRTISSCTEREFFGVCSEVANGVAQHSDNCNKEGNGEFLCWDREDDRWCRGTIVPTKGTFEEPVCPETVVGSCEELEDWGIRSGSCTCRDTGFGVISDITFGPFLCTSPSMYPDPKWCHGAIAPEPTNGPGVNECPNQLVTSCDQVGEACGKGLYKCYTGDDDYYWEAGAYGCWDDADNVGNKTSVVCTGLMKRDEPIVYPECPTGLTLQEARDADLGCSMDKSWGPYSEMGRFDCTYPTGHACHGEILPSNPRPLGDAVDCPPVHTSSWSEVKAICGENMRAEGLDKGCTHCSSSCGIGMECLVALGYGSYTCFRPPLDGEEEEAPWDGSRDACYGFVDPDAKPESEPEQAGEASESYGLGLYSWDQISESEAETRSISTKFFVLSLLGVASVGLVLVFVAGRHASANPTRQGQNARGIELAQQYSSVP